jgi:protoporphyrinogen/coproporphyrinogen III oxidase
VSAESQPIPHVVIIGGGISGLSAAYYLERLANQTGRKIVIRLLEAGDHVGGVIRSERHGDYLIEAGPDSFLAVKPAAIELCRELGLDGDLIGSNDERRKTYVWQGGKLRELPDGLMFVVPTKVWPIFRGDLLSPAGKARLALAPFLPPVEKKAEDRAVAEFITRRFGSEVLERLAEPLLAAVYGAEVDTLSARAVLPQLVAIEEKYGNLWRGLSHARAQMMQARKTAGKPQPLFLTLRQGLGELVDRTRASLKMTELCHGIHVRGILGDAGGYRIEHAGGKEMAQAVIVATPAHAAAKLVEPLDAALASELGGIRYHSSAIVALGYDHAEVGDLAGFGFVVPRKEGKRMTACTWVSTKFPFRGGPQGVLLRCFLGSARNPELLERSDDAIVSDVLRELGESMQLRAKPVFTRVYRWDRRMPQYDVGHLARLTRIETSLATHPGLFLAGNGYRGLGIPDCIQSGSVAATAAIAHLKSEPRAPARRGRP